MIRINLLPRDEMPAASRISLPNVGNFAPLVLVLVALVGVGAVYMHQSNQIKALNEIIVEEEAETRRLAPEIAKIKRLNQQRKDLNDRLDVITRLQRPLLPGAPDGRTEPGHAGAHLADPLRGCGRRPVRRRRRHLLQLPRQ